MRNMIALMSAALVLLSFGCVGDAEVGCYAPAGEFIGTLVLDPTSTACADVEDLSGENFRFASAESTLACGPIGSRISGDEEHNSAGCLVVTYVWGSADEEGFYDIRQRIEMTCDTGGACAWEYDIIDIRER